MKVARDMLTIHTEQNQEFIDITKRVRDAVGRSAIQSGVLILSSVHTTLALFVNEFQSALIHDLGILLQTLVPRRAGYRHDDPRYSDCDRGNAHAHLRSMLLGRSVALAIDGGELALGQFESLIVAELDGPRTRRIAVQIIGE
ncbi:MAG TPA: secondary thiamine-phosphate synthase enzyme YjbQ [Methylomirabilota bacterium]|jgi:secondary thiamine-phosphate synthase enzyme|nr:secondary thiamine-phosphate synthase enzyme YjbQ [Methylomirabilota bacterium]